jgi:hypothetical protein
MTSASASASCKGRAGDTRTDVDTGMAVFMGKCVEEEVGVCTELPSVSVEASPSSSDPSGVGGKDAAVILKNSLCSGSKL